MIVHFSVEFAAVDKDQVVKLADNIENEELLSAFGSVVLVNITADKGDVSFLITGQYSKIKYCPWEYGNQESGRE